MNRRRFLLGMAAAPAAALLPVAATAVKGYTWQVYVDPAPGPDKTAILYRGGRGGGKSHFNRKLDEHIMATLEQRWQMVRGLS